MFDLERRLRGKRKLTLTFLCAAVVLLNIVFFLRGSEWYPLRPDRVPFLSNHDTDVVCETKVPLSPVPDEDGNVWQLANRCLRSPC